MNQGKHLSREAKKKIAASRLRRKAVLLLSLILILVGAIGGTMAYLVTSSAQVANSFAPSSVTCMVNLGNTVTNTGDIPAYIRAAVTANWVNADGSIHAIPPSLAVAAGGGWTSGGDGYFYYSAAVSPNDSTSALSVSTADATPDGCSLRVDMAAEAIQAAGDTDLNGTPAITDAWGASVGG